MNCATSCINLAVEGYACFTNRHLVIRFNTPGRILRKRTKTGSDIHGVKTFFVSFTLTTDSLISLYYLRSSLLCKFRVTDCFESILY